VNILVETIILVAKEIEEIGNGLPLVERTFKIVPEAAAREIRGPLWQEASRSADGSDPGTCGGSIG
jgi:hypothetical protein